MPAPANIVIRGAPRSIEISSDGTITRLSGRLPLEEMLEELRPLVDQPLSLGDGHDWWEPLTIDLLWYLMELRAASGSLAGKGVTERGELRIQSHHPTLWRAAGGAGARIDRVGSARLAARLLASPARGEVLKSWGRDRQARILEGARRSRSPKQARLAMLGEVPSESMLSNLLQLADGDTAFIAADPRVARESRRRGIPTVELLARRLSMPGGARAAGPLRARLRDFDAGLDEAFGGALQRLLGGLVADYGVLKICLRQMKPRALILASDQHRYGVLAAWAGRELRIPTVVVQHGFALHAVGYLPVRADKVATIGPASTRWFAANGTSADRLTTTGSPRFAERSAWRTATPKAAVLLVTLHPQDDEVSRTLAGLACRAAVLQGETVLLRPHPSDRRWMAIDRRDAAEALGIDIAHPWEFDYAAVETRLASCDLVLTWDSTLAFDALQAGVPVLTLGAPASPMAQLGFPAVTDPAEVSGALREGQGREAVLRRLDDLRTDLIANGGAAAVASIRSMLSELVTPA